MESSDPERLAGFDSYRFPATAEGRPVYWRGPSDAPGVILLHELPGMTPECVELGRELSTTSNDNAAYQVHMPLIFGTPGREGNAAEVAKWTWCIRREFSMLSRDQPSPITDWVAELVREVAQRSGVPRVGVIGMCLTGSLVFGLVAQAEVGAVVASQPSLPAALTPAHTRSVGMPFGQLQEDARDGAPVLAMRYRGDVLCPRARVETLAEAFGHTLPPPVPGQTQDVTLGRLRVLDIPGRKHALLTLHRHEEAVSALRQFLSSTLHGGDDW